MRDADQRRQMSARPKAYLGDGAYVEFDGWAFVVSAPRGGGEHYVSLEERELANFLQYVEAARPGLLRRIMPAGELEPLG